MFKSAMKISIAMATYNGAKYLREQLDSFATQTRLPNELIVCDDCSLDETVTILEDFAATAPFEVKIVQNERNLGFVQNFGKALSLCSGDVVFLSDQDDWWFPEKIKTQVEYLDENPSCMVAICDQEICDGDLKRSGRTKLGNIRGSAHHDSSFNTGCCMVLRRQFLRLVLPIPDGEPAHDTWIGRLSTALQVRAIVERPLQLYRRHDNNASHWIMSRTSKVSTLDVLRLHGFRSAHDGWRREIFQIKSVIDRLKLTASAEPELAEFFSIAIEQQDARADNIRRRIAITTRPRIIRWPFVLAAWLTGGYHQFTGWKSAVKDLVRP